MNPRDLIASARAAHWPDGSEHESVVPALCDALETALDDLAAQTSVLRLERNALSEALDRDATSERALCQRLVELERLRAQVGELQADCSRHERRARVEAARADYWMKFGWVTQAETSAAVEALEAARRVLESHGAKP